MVSLLSSQTSKFLKCVNIISSIVHCTVGLIIPLTAALCFTFDAYNMLQYQCNGGFWSPFQMYWLLVLSFHYSILNLRK